jgi:hypothetical protein
MGGLLLGINFRHIRREANLVAHELCQLASTQQRCVVMRLNAPERVREIIAREAPEGVVTETSCNSALLPE